MVWFIIGIIILLFIICYLYILLLILSYINKQLKQLQIKETTVYKI